MPQLDFFTYFTQYHYLLLAFFTLYTIVSLIATPSIHSISYIRSKLSSTTERSNQTERSGQYKGFTFIPELGNEIIVMPLKKEEILNMPKEKNKI